MLGGAGFGYSSLRGAVRRIDRAADRINRKPQRRRRRAGTRNAGARDGPRLIRGRGRGRRRRYRSGNLVGVLLALCLAAAGTAFVFRHYVVPLLVP